jgi:uncharacterized SAM-binding protein YcdF (DUF218 family)
LAATALVVVAAGVAYAARRPLLTGALRWLDVGQRPRASQYVMILGGGLTTRPFAAALLVKRHLAGEVLMARQWDDADAAQWLIDSEQALARQVLIRRGVPASQIHLIGRSVVSTFDEATALAEFLREHPSARAMVVTNDYHTRRARWSLARVVDHAADRLTVISIPTDEFSAEDWWRTSVGRMLVVGEYAKLVYYQFRHGDGLIGLVVVGLAIVGWRYGRSVRRKRAARAAEDGPGGSRRQ